MYSLVFPVWNNANNENIMEKWACNKDFLGNYIIILKLKLVCKDKKGFGLKTTIVNIQSWVELHT